MDWVAAVPQLPGPCKGHYEGYCMVFYEGVCVCRVFMRVAKLQGFYEGY